LWRTHIMKVCDTNHVPNFTICVYNFPHGEVLVKVSIMEFGLKQTIGKQKKTLFKPSMSFENAGRSSGCTAQHHVMIP